MTRDISIFLITVFTAAAAVRIGWTLPTRPRRARLWVVVLTFVAFAVGTLDRLFGLITPLTPLFFAMGGTGWLSIAAVLLLLSYAAPTRPNRAQRGTVVFLMVIVGLMFLSPGSSPLYWRLWGMEHHSRRPDATGLLVQSSVFTCAPAAAAMLIATEGVSASEGEMAYYSGTTFLLGTSLYGVSLGMNRYLHGRHIKAVYRRCSLREAQALARPCVAAVDKEGSGPHAVLVKSIQQREAVFLDPYLGEEVHCPKSTLAKWWLGEIVYLESAQTWPVNR